MFVFLLLESTRALAVNSASRDISAAGMGNAFRSREKEKSWHEGEKTPLRNRLSIYPEGEEQEWFKMLLLAVDDSSRRVLWAPMYLNVIFIEYRAEYKIK